MQLFMHRTHLPEILVLLVDTADASDSIQVDPVCPLELFRCSEEERAAWPVHVFGLCRDGPVKIGPQSENKYCRAGHSAAHDFSNYRGAWRQWRSGPLGDVSVGSSGLVLLRGALPRAR